MGIRVDPPRNSFQDTHELRLLHSLWDKAHPSPEYVKAEWMELEGILTNLQRIAYQVQEEKTHGRI